LRLRFFLSFFRTRMREFLDTRRERSRARMAFAPALPARQPLIQRSHTTGRQGHK
jgi:hypothetical protein